MIVDSIINFFLSVPLLLLRSLPDIVISIPEGVFDWLLDVSSMLGYILPVKALMPILGIMVAVNSLKIAWAILLRVKSFIPTMGA